MYKKEKKLWGLFYKKTNLLNSELIIRFLGLKILYTKVDILKSTACIYIYPFRFLSFKKNIRKNIQKNYMEYVLYKYPGYKNYIIFSSGFGEIYHTLFYLKQIANRDNISDNTLIVFNKKGLNDLYKLFNINFDSTVIESIEGIMLDKIQEYNGAKFITPLNFDYFGAVEKSICNHKAHYYEALNSNIFFDLNCNDVSVPKLRDNLIVEQFLENTLKKHFVIISPEASTLNFLPYDFWWKLVQKLKFAGYEVLVNTNNPHLIIENSISSWKVGLSVEEILQLSKYAEAIIGLRSGFLEILADISQTKSFIIYDAFNCFAQNNLSVENVLSGFSVKKLPNIKSELIHEYKFNTYNDFQNLIDEILSNLSKKKNVNCLLDTKLDDINLKIGNLTDYILTSSKKNVQEFFDYNLENPLYSAMYKKFYHTFCILENSTMKNIYVERLSEDFILSEIKKLQFEDNKNIYLFTDSLNCTNICKLCSKKDINDIKNEEQGSFIIVIAYNLDYLAKEIINECQKYNLKYYAIKQYGTPQARFFHTNKFAYEVLCSEQSNDPKMHFSPLDFENIFQALEATKQLVGDYVEIGTFQGASARATLNYINRSKLDVKCYFVDTYEGFTYEEAQNSEDIIWTNTHTDTSMRQVQEYLSNYENFELVQSNIIQNELPDNIQNIRVANIDVDMYEAVKAALYKVKDRVVKNGIVIAEDYGHTPALIGAQKAVDEFLQENPNDFIPIYLHSGQMFLIKKG